MGKPMDPAEITRRRVAIDACGGDFAKAAKRLGLPRQTMRSWAKGDSRFPNREGSFPNGEGAREIPATGPPSAAIDRGKLGRIAELLERSGIPLEEVGRIDRVRLNEWQGLSKDADGNATVTDMHGASLILTPRWADGPEWPTIQPGPPVAIRPVPRPPKVASGWRIAVVLPDIQVGYYWRHDRLVPTHDEAALSVALDIVSAADPDVVVMVGDNIDLPEFSRYRLSPTFQRTTQPAIDRVTTLMAELRARVRPNCEIVYLAGNHEERLPNYIIDNARAAFGLKRGNAPASWPVLSIPDLCRFAESGVTYLPGYPANVYWINSNLNVIHGHKVRTGGSTAHGYLPEIRHSTIFGHVHRVEHAAVTRLTHAGPRTYHAVSPGCLCRTDGSVPGHESGQDLDGIPLATVNNWQQGALVIPFEPGEGRFAFEQVEIWNGWATWRGREYRATKEAIERAS